MYKGLILADLKIVRNLADSEIRYEKLQAAYHMQQAIEKTIKLKANVCCGVELWGHNIAKLLRNCINLGIDIKTPKLIVKNADRYSRWEASGRYSPTAFINKNSIWAAYRVTVEWLNSGNTK